MSPFLTRLVSIINKKWKNIRTCYSRDLLQKKNLKSGSATKNHKQYTYFEQLRFLETLSKKTKSNFDTEGSNSLPETLDCGIETVNDVEATVIDQYKAPSKKRSKHEDDELIATLKKKIAVDPKQTRRE